MGEIIPHGCPECMDELPKTLTGLVITNVGTYSVPIELLVGYPGYYTGSVWVEGYRLYFNAQFCYSGTELLRLYAGYLYPYYWVQCDVLLNGCDLGGCTANDWVLLITE